MSRKSTGAPVATKAMRPWSGPGPIPSTCARSQSMMLSPFTVTRNLVPRHWISVSTQRLGGLRGAARSGASTPFTAPQEFGPSGQPRSSISRISRDAFPLSRRCSGTRRRIPATPRLLRSRQLKANVQSVKPSAVHRTAGTLPCAARSPWRTCQASAGPTHGDQPVRSRPLKSRRHPRASSSSVRNAGQSGMVISPLSSISSNGDSSISRGRSTFCRRRADSYVAKINSVAWSAW